MIGKKKIAITIVALFSFFTVSSSVSSAYAFGGQDVRNFLGSVMNAVFQGKAPSETNSLPDYSTKALAKLDGVTIDSDAFTSLQQKVKDLSFQISSFNQTSGGLTIDTTNVNLLKNSSFEVGVGGIPTQWNAILDSNSANTFSNGEGIHSGSYGLKFVGGGTGNLGISQPSTKTVPQRTYTYSAWVKMINIVGGATLRLGFWDEQNNKEGPFKNVSLSGTRDWFRVSMTVTTPGLISDAKNYYPMVQVQGLTNGNVYIDDVQLTEGGVLTPYNSALANIGSGGLSLGDLGGGLLHSNGSGVITSSGVNLGSSDVTGTLPIGNGGTGSTSIPSNGQLLIGNGTGYGVANLTAGSGVTITNSAGGITIAASTGASTFSSLSLTNTSNQLTLGTANTVTISSTAPSASRTYTIPDFGSNDTFTGLSATQTLTNKTLTAPAINGTVTTTGLTLPAFTAAGNISGSGSPTVSGFGAINGLTLTSNADGFSVAGGTTSRTLTVTGANITVGSTIQPTSAGTLAVQSNGANAVTLDTGGAAAVNVGTVNANALSFGNATSNPAYTFNGSGSLSTSTGANNLNGNTTIAANKSLTLSSGTGTVTQNYSNTTGSGTTLNVTNSNAGAGTSVNGLSIGLVGTAPASGTNVNTGINFPNVTGVTNNTFNALTFGTGYTNFVTSPNINVSSAGVISGAGSYNGVSLSSTTVQPVAAGLFTFQSNGANAVTLDTGGAAAVNVGTVNANAINLGASTTLSAGKSLTLSSGTGQISQTYSNTAAGNASLYNVTNGNTGVTATAVSGLDITLTNATNTNSSNTLNGLTFEAAGNNNSNIINGLNFASATGYTNFLKTPSIVITSAGNITGAGTIGSGAITDTSSSANALAVGQAGIVNPAFNVDSSTASSATGLNVKSAAATGGLALSVISSGASESLTIDAKGAGALTLNGTATGNITLGRATTVTTGGLTVTAGGLTVSAGNVSLTSTATTGTTTFAGSGASNVNHLVSTQTTLPTETVVTYTAGTVTAGSTDTKGQFTVTTTAATGSVTLVFTGAYASAPTCITTPASLNTQADASKTYVTTATTGLTINYAVAPAANLQTWNYVCIQ